MQRAAHSSACMSACHAPKPAADSFQLLCCQRFGRPVSGSSGSGSGSGSSGSGSMRRRLRVEPTHSP